MGPLAIILGSALTDKKHRSDTIRLVTPEGNVVTIQKKDVVHVWNADASGDLKRYAIPSDAVVSVEIPAQIFCAPSYNYNIASSPGITQFMPRVVKSTPPKEGGETQYKYIDDQVGH